jgi:hypothetical protein
MTIPADRCGRRRRPVRPVDSQTRHAIGPNKRRGRQYSYDDSRCHHKTVSDNLTRALFADDAVVLAATIRNDPDHIAIVLDAE